MTEADSEARELLRQAQALHSAGRINEAIATAQRALEINPRYVEALTYLGTTLVTRRLAYDEGLAILERAVEYAPDDPGACYSLGWCYEFVAYRLEKTPRPARDPYELYEAAARELARCLELNPEQKLREDAEDLLASIRLRLD
jgi:tetratricopeptide (TPR) repeat protein